MNKEKFVENVFQISGAINQHPFVVLDQIAKLVYSHGDENQIQFEKEAKEIMYEKRHTVPWLL